MIINVGYGLSIFPKRGAVIESLACKNRDFTASCDAIRMCNVFIMFRCFPVGFVMFCVVLIYYLESSILLF